MDRKAGNRMVLFPETADFFISEKTMVGILAGTGLLGEAETESRFLPGERFLSLVCFLGCSPNVELGPNQYNKAYCAIEVASSPDQVRCEFNIYTKAPKCPVCRREVSHPQHVEFSKPCNLHICSGCHSELDLSTLNWRKSAVFARSWIEIHNIFESEAVPHDNLMQHLENETGRAWKVAYLR